MTQVFEISGLHCGACVTRAQRAVEALAPGALVTLEPPRLTLPDGIALTPAAIDEALAKVGEYRVKAPA